MGIPKGTIFARSTTATLILVIFLSMSLVAFPFPITKATVGGEEQQRNNANVATTAVSDISTSSNNNNSASSQNGASTDVSSSSNVTAQSSTIPENAQGPMIPPEKGYLVEEIRGGLYWVTDGSYNTMFLVTDEGVVAIDAPPSIGANYLKAISEVTDKPIRYVIYSHSHLDHIGAAASIFPENATFIAHEDIAEELQRAHNQVQTTQDNLQFQPMPLPAYNVSQLPPIPAETFSQNHTLQVGNQTLLLNYHGNNHEEGNLFIHAPEQRTLMLVDVIFPGWVPFAYLGLAEDVYGYVQAHDIALNYDFDTFVGGHLTRLGAREDVQIQREFMTDLINASNRANQKCHLWRNIAESRTNQQCLGTI